MPGRVILFGSGGAGRDLVAMATAVAKRRFDDPGAVAFVDEGVAGAVMGVPIIDISTLTPKDLVVLSIGNSATRARVVSRYPELIFISLISDTALLGPAVSIGTGSVVQDYATITANTRIGRFFQANNHVHIAHDCVIGDFVTFAPRVTCNGNVHIGDGAYIGAGALLRHGQPDRPLVIGAGATVGMGAVVTRDVAPGTTVVGNPARLLA